MSGLAALAAALRSRFRIDPSGRTDLLRLEQVLALDPRRRLALVRCGERRVLLLTGGAQDMVVGWLESESGSPPS